MEDGLSNKVSTLWVILCVFKIQQEPRTLAEESCPHRQEVSRSAALFTEQDLIPCLQLFAVDVSIWRRF